MGDLAYADNYVSLLAPSQRMALRAALRKRFVSWETGVSTCTSTQIACSAVIISHATHCKSVHTLVPQHADDTHLHRCVCLLSMRQSAPIQLACVHAEQQGRELECWISSACNSAHQLRRNQCQPGPDLPASLVCLSTACPKPCQAWQPNAYSKLCWYQAC